MDDDAMDGGEPDPESAAVARERGQATFISSPTRMLVG